jgi:hypothetical protein
MEINIEVSGFLSSEKKILKISNFELLFIKRNPKTNTSNIEMRCHIKYITLRDIKNTKAILERKDQNEKYTIKTSNTEDMDNLESTISREQTKYKLFIKDYYNDNNSYNLIDGDSFFDYFASIKDFLQTFIRNIDLIFINPELEKLLDLINTLLVKIDYYLGVINSNENKLKERDEQIYSESNEIKQLLLNLKEAINSCSFGLHQGEVKDYINSFKNTVKEKAQEINILIDEIKYNLANYLALGVECQENKNEIFESKEEELTNVLLENESLKMQNENLMNENQIISQFLNDNKNKK